ncbi:MAG: SAM-dependent methyltransferase, partial [Aeromicrobium sp.]|nr:SAM-dependent methyltransferase [Aeromicrobium sp.]
MAQPLPSRNNWPVNKAAALLDLAEETLGLKLPIRLRAWDGSEAGVPGAPVVVIRSKRALRHIIWKPSELGVARAYVQGDLDIEGDLGDGLRAMWNAVRDARAADATAGRPKVGPKQVAKGAALALRLGAVGRRPAAPLAESNLTGELHSKERDQAAISHLYDLSNDFYELILDP